MEGGAPLLEVKLSLQIPEQIAKLTSAFTRKKNFLNPHSHQNGLNVLQQEEENQKTLPSIIITNSTPWSFSGDGGGGNNQLENTLLGLQIICHTLLDKSLELGVGEIAWR